MGHFLIVYKRKWHLSIFCLKPLQNKWFHGIWASAVNLPDGYGLTSSFVDARVLNADGTFTDMYWYIVLGELS